MSGADRFWDLLPSIYRRLDVETAGPLRGLLEVLAEQAAVIERDIARLYDNWFIETCEDWVVPYIGDLIGYRPVHDTGDPAGVLKREDEALARILTPRREVANSIRYRRRKGSLALLEDLARDVSGWSAKAVEYADRLAAAQHAQLVRPTSGTLVSMRGTARLVGTGLDDPHARTPEVRRINSGRTRGRFGPHQVGLYVARLRPRTVTRVDAVCVESNGANCFAFSSLGHDMSLFAPTAIDPAGLPGPLRRAQLAGASARRGVVPRADPAVFGPTGSVMIWIQRTDNTALEPVAPETVIPADLRAWRARPSPGLIALDPERGRIVFPEVAVPRRVVVSYLEGVVGDLGGGEYPRRLAPIGHRHHYRVSAGGHAGSAHGETHNALHEALEVWHREQPKSALIEIMDSQIYDERRVHLRLQEGQQLEIRAANRTRPILRLIDYNSAREDALLVEGHATSTLILDGLTIVGNGLHVRRELELLRLRHCTLVPGWELTPEGARRFERAASLSLDHAAANVSVQHSILGSIQVHDNEAADEPSRLVISDSIVDAGAGGEAIFGPNSYAAHVALTALRSTFLGRTTVHAVTLAEDTIFMQELIVARRQIGCVRYCYLGGPARTPRRYNCIPPHDAGQSAAAMAPVFVTTRYGTPGYCQLVSNGPEAIRRGAGDQSEIGVFHNLFDPQREANLRARLAEHVPAAIDVDVIYVN